MDNDTLTFLFFVVVMLICMPILLLPDETNTNDSSKEFGLRKFSLLTTKCNGPHQWTYNKQKTILQCKRCGTIAGKTNDRE